MALKIADCPVGDVAARNVALIEHSNENRAAPAFSAAHSFFILPGMSQDREREHLAEADRHIAQRKTHIPGNVKSFES